MLAGIGKSDQRLDTSRVTGERSEVPPLRLSRELRDGPTREGVRCPGETLSYPELDTRVDDRAAACRLQQQ